MNDQSGEVTVTATSKKGDLDEAILTAIGLAKNELKTDFVRWRLEEISGENGGVTLQHHISVTMTAKGPA